MILHDTETIWTKLFKEQVQGASYTPPKLIIFSDSVASGCGNASAAMGPFYCPADEQVYIDPTFFDELATRHHAKGDFAQAYVLAHEVAHHVQNLTGFSEIVNQVRSQGDERFTNQIRCDWNCRPIFSPVSGLIMLTRPTTFWKMVIWKKASTLPTRSATTHCSVKRLATSFRNASLTAL